MGLKFKPKIPKNFSLLNYTILKTLQFTQWSYGSWLIVIANVSPESHYSSIAILEYAK
jgi:hypothetical protein